MNGKTVRTLMFLACCVALAACSSKAERIQSGLRKGAQYAANSDWDHAGVEVRNVLQMDPKNAAAYLIAARIEDGKGGYRNAFANYSKVVELDPASIDGRLGMARIYLLSGELDKAATLIRAVLATAPQNVRAQALQVALLARQGKLDAARVQADRIVQDGQALDSDSSMVLAGFYFNLQLPEPALGLLDRAATVAGRDIRLLQMSAEIAEAAPAGSPLAARADGYFARAVGVAPQDSALWNEWAAMRVRRNEMDQAERVLRDAVKAVPDDHAREIALLSFEGQHRDKVQAEKDFRTAIDAQSRNVELRFAFADFLRANKRLDDAVPVLQSIIDGGKETAPAVAAARGQLAALYLESGKTELARPVLAALLKSNPRDGTGLLLRGRLELADGDARSAVADLRSAAKDKPASTEVASLLANALRQTGDRQLAREALADVVKFNPNDARAHLLLAADMAQTHEYASALPEVTAALRADPRNVGAYEMKVEMALAAGDLQGAEAGAHAAESQFPNGAVGQLLEGRVLAREHKPALALAQYDEAAKRAPSDPQPVVAAVALLTAQHQFAAATQRIDALEKSNPRSALARQMRGELALATGDLPLAAKNFGELVDLPGAPAPAYRNLATVMVARKDLDGALAVLQRGETAYPADASLPAARAEFLGRAGRIDDAISVYEQMLHAAPANDAAANNLAYVLAQSKRDPASLERALALVNRFASSSDPSYVDTLGLVQYRLGRYDQAAAALERARTLAPDDVTVQLHYGMALYKKGDVQGGSELVRKALATKAPLVDHDEAASLIGHV